MKKKVMALVLCMVLLVAVSITGTLAYLTSQDQVTNTFTVGKVAITMDESDQSAADPTTAERVQANEYKVLPGSTYTKDPIIHVGATSEDCWLFVYIDNELINIEATGDTSIAAQMAAKGWNNAGDGYWSYGNAAVAGGTDVELFTNFTVKGDTFYSDAAADAGNILNLKNYDNKTIVVKAFAVQSANLTQAAALDQAKALNN